MRTTDAGTDANSALWIVGGSSPTSDYPGLQKFSFGSNTWETIVPVVNVTQDRQNHASVFLNSSSEILIYAGSQDGSNKPTTQTFLVSTIAPYNVVSWGAQNTPVISPNLLQWNESAAITLGGSENDTSIYQFTKTAGWVQLGTSLSAALSASEKCTLVQVTDNSKVLNIYDMGVSPNQVSQVVLQNADGIIASVGQTVVNATATRKRKRVALNAWPSYNSTFAPTATRTSYSLAQDDAGTVAIAGGNTQDPVALFNEPSNAWIDSTHFFGLDATVTSTPTSSATPSSTSSTSASTTSSAAAAPTGGSSHPKTSVILGATLGSILGVIVLLILALLLLRYKKKKHIAAAAAAEDEKKRMSFADRGAPFMMEAGGAVNKRGSGYDSLAILGGKVGPGYSRNLNTAGSDSSTTNLVPPQRWDASMGPIPGGATPPEVVEGQYLRPGVNEGQKRSSGWSRYFSGVGLDGADQRSRKSGHLSAGRLSSHLAPSPRVSQDASHYSASEPDLMHDCNTHGPTIVPELNLNPQWNASRVNNVVTGKPTVVQDPSVAPVQTGTVATGLTAGHTHQPRPSNVSRTSTTHSASSTRSSGPISSHDSLFAREGINEREWTPVTQSGWNATRNRDTSTSSVYTHKRGESDMARSPAVVAPVPGLLISHAHGASASNEPIFPSSPPNASVIAPFPSTVLPGLYTPGEVKAQKSPAHSDMSWVDLHTQGAA